MKALWKMCLPGVLAAASVQVAAQEALVLEDAQLDRITAGAQYSAVYGAGYAEEGTVSVFTKANTRSKPNGANTTKAELKLEASGINLMGVAAGESVAGDEYSGVYAEAYSPQGSLKIVIKTMSKVTPSGNEMTKSMVKVKAAGGGTQVYTARF